MYSKLFLPVLLLILILLLSACGGSEGSTAAPEPANTTAPEPESTAAPLPAFTVPEKLASDSLFVKKIGGLTDDFILGMDISSLLAEEASGVKYYDFDGKETDLLELLAAVGVNTVRVRVWNDPFDKDGKGYGGGNCTVDTALGIGKRAAKYGIGLLVDFHYSDFWADPGKQMAPKAWENLDVEAKAEALYQYTKESLEKLKNGGVKVTMVQLGNETNGAMCGVKRWVDIQALMAAGSKAVREVCPEALVAVHFANPENADNYLNYASKLAYYNLDYDVFASSYYPYWHGTLENLSNVLSEIAEKYDKKVMVMETSWAYTAEDTDFSGNTIGEGSAVVKNWPYTVQGQANAVQAVIDAVAAKTKNGIGVVYWEGAWISVGTESWEKNHEIWEKYGSGWASSCAGAYDPNDAGKYYGGCAVDNQAFFDAAGHPLESLKVWNLVRYGNESVPVVPDAIEDVALMLDINGEYKLPETVNAVMTDDSKQAVPVVWNITQEELENYRAKGPAKYEITGEAGGMEAHLQLSLIKYNFLKDWSFEEGGDAWTATDLGKTEQLYVEDKSTDSLTGSKHFHFWSAAKNSVKFTLEQKVDLPAGSYTFEISVMGGDAGTHKVYAYVKVNGEEVNTAPAAITSYNDWHTAVIERFEVQEGQEVTVGIYVECAGDGSGAWGKIDDAVLNSVGE